MLNHKNIELIWKIFPRKEDLAILKNFEITDQILNKTEKFLINLIKIENLKEIIQLFYFKEEIDYFLERLTNIKNFKDPFILLLKNNNFKIFLIVLLRLTNFLNHGSKNCNKKAFNFKTLIKLSKFKTVNK